MLDKNSKVCLVLGGHVNGYSIIRELYDCGIRNIALFDYGKSLARYSNKVKYRAKIKRDASSLLCEIKKLKEFSDYIVIYPTDDLQLEFLTEIYEHISDFCYIPLNRDNLLNTLDKNVQYQVCEQQGIPYPKSIELSQTVSVEDISGLTFPLLVKPTTRKDLTIPVFRNLYLENSNNLEENIETINGLIELGVNFLVSEFVPGDDTNIYAYTCFRAQDNCIYGEWRGKKLTQYPDSYGIFCSASNEAPQIVSEQGRRLADALSAYGIIEPEFKFDERTGEYKLMEVNLRSMMWNGVGHFNDVNLHYYMYQYATTGQVQNITQQDFASRLHFVLLLHEIPNLMTRSNYWSHFKHNIFGAKRRFAIFSFSDPMPFLSSLILLTKSVVKACSGRLHLS